jgi:hypothetical protein
MSPRRILVVANQTLGGEQLFQAIERHVGHGPSAFHVVVPAIAAEIRRRSAAGA